MAYNFRSQIEAIEKVIPRLYHEIYIPIAEAEMTVYRTKEPVSFANKTFGEKVIVKKGDVWGEPWDCGWFRITGTVPESAKGKSVSEKNIIIDTVKFAEDGSGDMIIRMYESGNTSTFCVLKLGFDIKSAYITNMLEENKAEANLDDNEILLVFKPFEVVTVRVIWSD